MRFTNDIDEGIASDILKFADDANIFKKFSCSEEASTVQDDLSRVYEQAWVQYNQGDIHNLEKVQRRALRMIDGFKELSYEERLRQTTLMSLEMRRLRGDLTEVF